MAESLFVLLAALPEGLPLDHPVLRFVYTHPGVRARFDKLATVREVERIVAMGVCKTTAVQKVAKSLRVSQRSVWRWTEGLPSIDSRSVSKVDAEV